MDTLEEMDKFLEKYKLLRPNQEEIENMNRYITSMKFKLWFKIFQQAKVQYQMASKANSIKHLEKN